jgi:CRISPR-associated protein Cas2
MTDPAQACWLVAYDIADPRRLRRVHRICRRYGNALQKSVFLCNLSSAELGQMQSAMSRVLHPAHDSVRYQPVCAADLRRSLHLGLQRSPAEQTSAWVV